MKKADYLWYASLTIVLICGLFSQFSVFAGFIHFGGSIALACWYMWDRTTGVWEDKITSILDQKIKRCNVVGLTNEARILQEVKKELLC